MLSKFTVIELLQTRSDSVCTVEKNYIKFNNPTAVELHYPPYVQLLIDAKGKQLAIRPCKEDAANAVKFSKPEGEQRYPMASCQPPHCEALVGHRQSRFHLCP